MSQPIVLDLFAGPGGWDEGVRPLGIRPLGIEWDKDACATGTAAGHWRLQTDVARMNLAELPRFGDVAGLIASPPCQGFSMAGKGRGRDDTVHLLQSLERVRTLADLEADLVELHATMTDDRSLLALEPLRYALALRPGWLAWEQVPAVLPLWEACSRILREQGYSVATGNLQAEQYGVPQTRRRAILVARSPELTAELGPVALPEPTHSRYYPRTPGKLDPGVLPWVSMAQALDYRARDLHPATRPAPALTEKARSWSHVYVNGTHDHAARRSPDQPAPTVMFGARANTVEWQLATGTRPNATRRPLGQPSPALAFGNDAASHVWTGADVTSNQLPAVKRGAERHARVTVEEAAVLQTFPSDYPWQGTRTAQYRQVGDAVPPLLAMHVVAAATGLALPVTGDVAA